MATASKIFKPTGRVWFTSDTHFGHALMLERRGFALGPASEMSPEKLAGALLDMDHALIENWNSVVQPQDTVFHLGDFIFKAPESRIRSVFSALKGRKNLVIGNHDFGRQDVLRLPWATPPEHRRFIKIDGQKIVLDHYAGRSWAGSFGGALQLFGHSHGRMPATSHSCDVGVDAWALMPIGLDDIRAYLVTQPAFRNMDDGETAEPEPESEEIPTPP